MKRFVFTLSLAVMACLYLCQAGQIPSFPIDGEYHHPVKNIGAKTPPGHVGIGPIYSWRSIASPACKSIVVSPSGDSIGVVYAQYSGNSTYPSSLMFGYSIDGGMSWTNDTIAPLLNERCYSSIAVDSIFRPYIVWQNRTGDTPPWPILLTYDQGGFGACQWATPVHLTDSGATYLPSMSISGNILLVAGFTHPAFGYDATLYMARADVSGGSPVWLPPWDLTGPYGWKPWLDAVYDDQDVNDFIISPDGGTVVSFNESNLDLNHITYQGNAYYPQIVYSTDGGINWPDTATPEPVLIYPDSLPAAWYAGGWWYRYEGLWANGTPHLVFISTDDGYNPSALLYSKPKVPGNYTSWFTQRINTPYPNQNQGMGYNADWPSLSRDSAGNIYCTYVNSTGPITIDIWCVASQDNGNTWTTPYRVTDSTYNYSWVEAAEFAGGEKIHYITMSDSLYYGSFNTSEILAMPLTPDPATIAPTLLQYGRSISDPIIDTLEIDTLDFIWTPSSYYGAEYYIQISNNPSFIFPVISCRNYGCDKVNYFLSNPKGLSTKAYSNVGLPFSGPIFWKVMAYLPEIGYTGIWSDIYRFVYDGIYNNDYWVFFDGAELSALPTYRNVFKVNVIKPNPALQYSLFEFTLPVDQAFNITIYNIAGQFVRNIAGNGHLGVNKVRWNINNEAGQRVAPGVYLYRLVAGANKAIGKLVVLR